MIKLNKVMLKKSLDIRMMPLKMGIMNSPIGKGLWKYIKVNRDDEFILWFEHQITGRNLLWMKISSREISVKIWTENCENWETGLSPSG